MKATGEHWLQRWLPAQRPIDAGEGFRASAGALIGILVTGLVGLAVLGPGSGRIWLVAPMGASAVLLFAVPSSPLAQPWSIIGGNLVAAVVGVTAARWIPEPAVAAAAAVGIAIGIMLALRCLHPPSGAVALVAVLGGVDVRSAGYAFVATPVLLDSAVILAVALLYNNLTGRRYPHDRMPQARSRPRSGHDGERSPSMVFDAADLAAALAQFDQVIDVGTADLGALFRTLEAQVYRRRFGALQCRHLMSSEASPFEFATELAEAWRAMREREVQAVPVVDRGRMVIGIVTRGDFVRHADMVDEGGLRARLARFLRRTEGMHSDKHEVVGQIMAKPVRTALDTSSIADLVPLMTEADFRHVPIVDGQGRLVGMVAQADVIAALYETVLAREPMAGTSA